jgi:ubiquinone/menaquinone biosynthesis C-methylase UbiE
MSFYVDHVLPYVINVVMDNKAMRRIRSRVTAGLVGEIAEIGFGTGHNLAYLPTTVTRVLAVEPSALSVRLARKRLAATPVPVDIVGLDGQQIPLADASVDAVLCTWSLCTIPDPVAAVREMRRILRPDGEFRFAEHGLAPEPKVQRWQRRLNGLQQRVGGGCNLGRAIDDIIEAGGMRITRLERYYEPSIPKPYGSTYEGAAVPA